MHELLASPAFYLAAVPAVILVGLSKGGFGGAAGFVGVPLMSLAMPPVQAAAILLPILVLTDVVGLWTWRGVFDKRTLVIMLPGALCGIAVGWALAAFVTEEAIRLVVGAVTLLFVGRWVVQKARRRTPPPAPQRPVPGAFWGGVAGFTSFVAHVGGPPYQVYTLPLGLSPAVFTGTSAIFFAATNAVKLVPYFLLGQFDAANLSASLVLMPLAPVFTLVGAWLVRRMKPDAFYVLTYVTVALVALKLVWDSVTLGW